MKQKVSDSHDVLNMLGILISHHCKGGKFKRFSCMVRLAMTWITQKKIIGPNHFLRTLIYRNNEKIQTLHNKATRLMQTLSSPLLFF
jgi:hypothetical protein